jgi:cyanate permease
MGQYIHVPFATALLLACVWTTVFSLTIKPGIRRFRNLGILASYVLPLIFLVVAGWRLTLVTWALFGVAGGVIYIIWEIIQRSRNATSEHKSEVSPSHLVFGLVAWPIMVPEAVEYMLAEFGMLRA